ncbi:MAG: PLP-dependent aminotransferase family protein [bacterium]|nr:PLP-dependent aminotransferase family protein [bacterium]
MDLMIPLQTASESKTPLYEQIYRYLKEEIRSKALLAGSRLPSTRTLAEHLKVSRSTTQMAYDQLLSEGYIEARPYRGYFVLDIKGMLELKRETPAEFISMEEETKRDCVVDFSPRGIDLESFPYGVWRKITKKILVDDKKELFLSGNHQGEQTLREAIGSYLHMARGVQVHPEQIVLGAGNEYLLLLLWQILGGRPVIGMENPTYRQAYRVFFALGCQVKPIAMDAKGIRVDLLEKEEVDVAYVMPSHQYPTGVVMPVGRRMELLRWAGEREGRYIIEDDYDSEFRYRGKPIPALQGSDQKERVIYIGTFSRSIAPAIRISYMVLPQPLLQRYREKYAFYASTVSRIDQNILYEFLVSGAYERHLNKMRATYKAKHDLLLAKLRPLEVDFRILGEHAGVHILLRSRREREEISEEELVERAAAAGVRVYGLSSFFIHARHNFYPPTIVLGYANLSEEEIAEGVKRLKEAYMKEKKE